MNHLLRDKAPITEAGWSELDGEAQGAARARRSPPARSSTSAAPTGGTTAPPTSAGSTRAGRLENVGAARRRVLPVVELRAAFTVSRSELDDLERGAEDIDLGALDEAARRIAHAENIAVFHGWPEAGIRGIAEACTHDAIALSDDFNAYSRHTAEAVETLLRNGHHRPVRARARPRPVHRRDPDDRARRLPALRPPQEDPQGGPIVWAPGVHGAVVVSLRGGDFLFESGQDLSIGYTTTTPSSSTSTSRRASPSASPRPRRPASSSRRLNAFAGRPRTSSTPRPTRASRCTPRASRAGRRSPTP